MFSVAFRLFVFCLWEHTVLSAVLCMAVIIAFLYVQTASSTRCVFYDVTANDGCLLH